MNPISIEEYWKGRDVQYAGELTQAYRDDAAETVRRANLFLQDYYSYSRDAQRVGVASGWRPLAVNKATKGAAPHSNHIVCRAVDLEDPFNMIDKFCVTEWGQKCLENAGLWHESPESTPRWCHLQIVKYGSWVEGKTRTFKV